MKKLILIFLSAVLFMGVADGKRSYIKKIKKHRKKLERKFKNPLTSPLKNKASTFSVQEYFEIDPEYKVEATFTHIDEGETFKIPTSNPKIQKEYVKYAKLDFQLKGESQSLYAYRSMKLAKIKKYKNYLFLPFTDLTTGKECYGGGRYLDLNIPEEGKVMLDFNLCYNPYCAYGDGWSCPIPPKENFLDARIEAGPKDYGEH